MTSSCISTQPFLLPPWFLSGFAHASISIVRLHQYGIPNRPIGPHFQASFGISSENCVAILTIIASVAEWPNLRAWKHVRQEESAMKETEDRKQRDVRAVQWLVDNINGSNETQTFVLAILGSFNQE